MPGTALRLSWFSSPCLPAAASLPPTPFGLLPSLPPAALGSNTGIIQFYENPPGLPLNGPTTTGTRCAGWDGRREEGKGAWAGSGRGEGWGEWEMGNPGNAESSPARRRRSWVGREGLSRLLQKAVLAHVCVWGGGGWGEIVCGTAFGNTGQGCSPLKTSSSLTSSLCGF